MVRVSRYKLKAASIDKTFQLLFEIIAKNNNQDEFVSILNELLSPTERIMIAKRVVIIYLLIKEIPHIEIAQALKVSSGTVSRYALLMEQKGKLYEKVSTLLTKEAVTNLLSDFFHELLIQPGFKIGHWREYWNHQKELANRKTSGI